tara:strand:+ start:380 stop:568 length:189 start_codon:yes stop_codon:yes gene_type:complete
MGQVKQALIEIVDLVCGCLQRNKTLSQTINELRELHDLKNGSNPYLLDEEYIEKTYYDYRGY